MRQKILVWSCVVILCTSMIRALWAQEEMKNEVKLKYFNGLVDERPEVRNWTYQDARDERTAKIQELMRVVQMENVDKSRGGPLSSAIGILKAYRAREAIYVLVSRLTFLPTTDGRDFISDVRTPPQDYYPAAQALIEINDERTPGILSYRIAQTKDPLEREMAAYVILKLLGKEEAISFLNAQSKKVSVEVQKNFSTAIEFVENFKPLLDLRPTLTPRKPKKQD